MTHHDMMEYRLAGLSYASIAEKAGVSRQRVQQILQPPPGIRQWVADQAHGCCAVCGLDVGTSGHVHHRTQTGCEPENYQDIPNLQYLCASCHIMTHHRGPIEFAEKCPSTRMSISITAKAQELMETLAKRRGISRNRLIWFLIQKEADAQGIRNEDSEPTAE